MAIIRDGEWRLFDHDFATGRTVWVMTDDAGHDVFRVDYPVSATVAENAKVRSMAQKAWAGDWHHVASVPLGLFHGSGLAEAQAQDDERFVSRWLNDSDNRAWRVKEGSV